MAPDTEKIAQFLAAVATYLEVPYQVELTTSAEEDGPVRVALQTEQDGNLLIGKNGQNLKAFEQVIRAVWARGETAGRQVVLDINDYRKTKEHELVQIIHETAGKVRATRKPAALDPMNPYERRLVHTELATYSDLATESIGQEPYRRVVIKPL